MTPDQHTIQEIMLDVGDGHQLYVQEWGNKKVKTPVLYFHGGPGSRVDNRAFGGFDPAVHRVIFFDQRGCGNSTPYGSIEHNTTPDLVADAIKILDHFNVKQAVLYGRSWGTTVALATAIAHPKRVTALVLGAIFLGAKRDIDWIDKGEFRNLYPEVWERHLAQTPVEHHDDSAAYHYKNILEGDEHAAFDSALAVQQMEYSVMNMDDRFSPIDPLTFDPTSARIYAHYMSNNCFMPEGHILKHAPKLTMPVWLVHGRYDCCCPPIGAYELHQALPNSRLQWTIANHRMEHEGDAVLRTILLRFAEL